MATVWYFAYGSNLHADVFRGQRGIEHGRTAPARVSGWRLVFDKPPLFPIGESYANLIEDPAAAAFGALYEIDEGELAQIDVTEGVPVGNYRRIEVHASLLVPLEGVAVTVSAHTLVSEKRESSLCPSDRYMGLVIDGASAHGLPEEHIACLRAVPSRPSTAEALALRERIDELMRTRK